MASHESTPSIAIVGMGPRGISVVVRLAAHLHPLEELLARVRSLVRRAAANSIGVKSASKTQLSFEDLHLNGLV